MKKLFLITVAGLGLAACQPLMQQPQTDQSEQITNAMVTAAREAAATGQIDQTLPFYEQLMQRNPDNAGLAMDYARLLRREGETTKALAVIKPFVVQETANPAMLTEYARLFLMENDPISAKHYAQNAFSQDPESVPTMLILTSALTLTGEANQAEILLRSAQKRAPKDWQDVIANNLALTLAAQGNLDEARAQMEKAVELTTRYGDRVEGNRDLIRSLEPVTEQ